MAVHRLNGPQTRVKVGCINWGHDDAPKAIVYLWDGSEMGPTAYYDTWEQAIVKARVLAAVVRRLSGV